MAVRARDQDGAPLWQHAECAGVAPAYDDRPVNVHVACKFCGTTGPWTPLYVIKDGG